MPRPRPLLAGALAVWLLLFVPSTGLNVAFAAGTANCSEGGVTNRWLGQQASSTNMRHGAQATFELWSLAQCSNPGLIEFSGSFVFSNVVPTDGGFNDILQIGAGNCRAANCIGGMHYYIGMGLTHTTPGCSGYQDVSPILSSQGTWASGSHSYTVKHISNVWRLYVDGTQKWVDLAESALCWTPRSSVWFGESWDYGDQIGGTATDKLTISNTKYMTTEGGAFTSTSYFATNPCNYAGNNGVFHCDLTSSTTFDIWTDR